MAAGHGRRASANGEAVITALLGRAMPEAVRAQVFDAFFTTKSDGLGLGLAIARGIVEDCGGSLTVRDDPAGGTIFRMALAKAPARGTAGVAETTT